MTGDVGLVAAANWAQCCGTLVWLRAFLACLLVRRILVAQKAERTLVTHSEMFPDTCFCVAMVMAERVRAWIFSFLKKNHYDMMIT